MSNPVVLEARRVQLKDEQRRIKWRQLELYQEQRNMMRRAHEIDCQLEYMKIYKELPK